MDINELIEQFFIARNKKSPNFVGLFNAGVTRLELATSGVTGQCSNQLNYTSMVIFLHHARREKSQYFGTFYDAGVTRLELATSGVTGQCSNQLNYTSVVIFLHHSRSP